jgi:hypothetical protein
MLVRAAVTLEMEQIKGSNPFCLWWCIPFYPVEGLGRSHELITGCCEVDLGFSHFSATKQTKQHPVHGMWQSTFLHSLKHSLWKFRFKKLFLLLYNVVCPPKQITFFPSCEAYQTGLLEIISVTVKKRLPSSISRTQIQWVVHMTIWQSSYTSKARNNFNSPLRATLDKIPPKNYVPRGQWNCESVSF